MARSSGFAQQAGLGETATGLGGKGLGKSTAKRHRYVSMTIVDVRVTLLRSIAVRSYATTSMASRREASAA